MSKVIIPKIRVIEKVTIQKIDINDIVVGKFDIFKEILGDHDSSES